MNRILSIIALLAGLVVCTPRASAQIAVIANPGVPWTEIDKNELLDFYTGDKQSWGNGRLRVVVYDLKSRGLVRDTFYGYLGKTSSRMRSIWLKRKLSGEGDPPESFDTEEEMLAHVASTEGAIGFVSDSLVTDDVKKLAVIPIPEQ